MLPSAWQMLDQMRGTASRGVWISSRIFRDFNNRDAGKANVTPD
jgi:hypothetical protein